MKKEKETDEGKAEVIGVFDGRNKIEQENEEIRKSILYSRIKCSLP